MREIRTPSSMWQGLETESSDHRAPVPGELLVYGTIPGVSRSCEDAEMPEIKTVPSLPLSYPFVERLIGTIRREYLDRTLFLTTADLENKLLDFRTYFNEHRSHTGLQGRTPDQDTPMPRPVASLHSYGWQRHCRGLYHTPKAA